MNRILLLVSGIVLGAACAAVAPSQINQMRGMAAALVSFGVEAKQVSDGRENRRDDHEENASMIRLGPEQITGAGIVVAQAGPGDLQPRLQVPGAIVPNADRIGRVGAKLLGTVAELRKRLGDSVQEGEVVAVIESREIADAKREFLSAQLTHELQQTLVVRAKNLWEGRAMPENEYLRVRNAFDDARVRLAAARQKLSALGLTEKQMDDLPEQPVESLRRQELRAPISGKVAERRVDLGALVGREGQESELYVIADLSEVWADLAIPPADLGAVHEGQEISIVAGSTGARTSAIIRFVSPMLDKDTRAARVIAAVPNPTGMWRPGSFITADISLNPDPADVVVPKMAVQRVDGDFVVFVRTEGGFHKRVVRTARQDEQNVEIISGLAAGEQIAVSNTFTLKAELGKAAADNDG